MKTSILLIIFLIITHIAIAADKITLEADKVSAVDNSTAIAEGNVIILYKNSTITADRIEYNRSTSEIDATGNVTLIDNETRFTSSHIRMNIDNETGTIDNSTGFYPPYTYIKAEKIKKVSNDIFYLDNAQITSCEGDTPDWSIKANTATVEKDQYIKSKHTTFRLNDIPVVYTPYLVWPIKRKRETGFLVPQFGSSSSKGQFISPRFFWDIDIDKDATFGVNYFTKIGPQYLSEFRYNLSKKDNIYLATEYIRHTNTESDKVDRWKIINHSNYFITPNLELKINTNYASDFRYEREFSEYTIYKDENEYSDDTTNDYINEFRLNYYSTLANVFVRYRDDMVFSDIDDGYTQTRLIRTPNIIIEKNNLDIWKLKANYRLDYNALTQKIKTFQFNDDTTESSFNVNRLHSKFKFYKPADIKIGSITPEYTQHFTRWYNYDDQYNITNTHKNSMLSIRQNNDSIDRMIYSVGMNVSLNEIYKKYAKFKHSIYNTYSYLYTPELSHGNILPLIEEDVIDKTNLHTYRMKNYLKSENWNATIEFIQEYDELLEKERFLPFQSKTHVNFKELFSAELDFKQDHYDQYTPYLKHQMKLSYQNLYLSTEYIYDEEITAGDNNNIGASIGIKDFYDFNFKLSETASRTAKNLSIAGLSEYQNKTFSAEVIYNSGCWSLGTLYKQKSYIDITNDGTKREKDHIYFVYIELKGLGDANREIHRY